MGYDWDDFALDKLRGIEGYEVIQALAAERRLPMKGRDGLGVPLLTIWARTKKGRPLGVGIRQAGQWRWKIVGAWELTGPELAELEHWEAETDE